MLNFQETLKPVKIEHLRNGKGQILQTQIG